METFANSFSTTLSAPISNGAAGDVVTLHTNSSADPKLQAGPFRADVGGEIFWVTAGQAGTSWTATRGYEGSPVSSHSANDAVLHYATAGALQGMAQIAQPNVFTSSQTFANSNAVSFTAGGTPKFGIPAGLVSTSTDDQGALRAGLNLLLPTSTPTTSQAILPDFWFSQSTLRLYVRNITPTEVDDPADITGRRSGPVGGYPYCGGSGTTTGTGGSPSSSIVVANSNANSLGNFATGQKLWSNATGMLPALISSVTPGSGTTTLGLTAPVTLGADTIFSIGGLTAVGAGGTTFQIRTVPAVAIFGGSITTPGALFLSPSAAMGFRLQEMSRDLTGEQQIAQGTLIRFSTVKLTRSTADSVFDITSAGNILVGSGSVGAGDTGDFLQIGGEVGADAVHTITGTATSGTLSLNFFPDPPPDGYATPLTTGSLNWNATAGQVQTALNALTIPSVGLIDVVCSGGPLGTAPIIVTYSGPHTTRHNWKRISVNTPGSGAALAGGNVSVENTTNGIPSSAANRFIFCRRREATFTADYFGFSDNTGANVLKLTATGALTLGASPGGSDNSTNAATTAWVRTYVASIPPGTSTADSVRASYTPTAAIADTFDRKLASSSGAATLVSGRLQFVPIWLTSGQLISNITFVSGSTPAGTPTHQWFSLYSTARAVLATTTDDTTTAWSATSSKTLAVSSPYTVPTTGFYLLGICVTATSVPNLTGIATIGVVNLLPPVYSGGSNTGLTDPTSAPSTATAITGLGGTPYAYVS